MYSHGSFGRVAGKRGHGGREYRPPSGKRKDPTLAPPPLKQCSCLCQFDLAEYMTLPTGWQESPAAAASAQTMGQRGRQQTGRSHTSFGGRQAVQALEQHLRSQFLVHCIIPGRKQSGPVAIVGQTWQEALPAAVWLLSCLRIGHAQGNDANPDESVTRIQGRIQRNVKDPHDAVLEGYWHLQQDNINSTVSQHALVQPFWVFKSTAWTALACPLQPKAAREEAQNGQTTNQGGNSEYPSVEALQTILDNVVFRMGNLDALEFIGHQGPTAMAMAAGNPSQTETLRAEILQALLQYETSTNDTP